MKPVVRPSWMAMAAALAAGGALAAAEPSPREAMKEGRKQLQAGDLPSAAAAFDRAAQAAPAGKLDPARARYNQGLALQQDEGKDAEAEAALDQALRTTDPAVQARALYNRGHLLAGRARMRAEKNDLDQAERDAARALESFQDSLILDPSDDSARVGFELTQPLLQEIQKRKQEQEQVNKPDPDGDKRMKEDPEGSEKMLKPDENGDIKSEDGKTRQDQTQDGEQQPPQPQPGEMNADVTPAGAEGEENPEDMSKDEAMMLLDAMKAEEAAMREKMRLNLGKQVPVDKDW